MEVYRRMGCNEVQHQDASEFVFTSVFHYESLQLCDKGLL